MLAPIRKAFFGLLLLYCLPGISQDGGYKTPPKDILDLVTAKPTPSVFTDSKGRWMVLGERSDMPTIEEMAQPELRIAGLRLNPRNFGPSRAASFTGLELKEIASGKTFSISGLPSNLRASSIQWSPDESKLAFTHTTNNRIDLYVVDIAAHTARKINSQPLNAILGSPYTWVGSSILYKAVPDEPRTLSQPGAPSGPVVQENNGKAAASRTYQDLIRSQWDEEAFDYLSSAQLVLHNGSSEKNLGGKARYWGLSVSPNDQYVMVTTIERPFSYLVQVNGFPQTVAVMDLNGTIVRTLAKNPSSEGQPIGFDDAETYARDFEWRSDEPATIVYVQALDKGLGRSKSEYRDAVLQVNTTGNEAPKELFRTRKRFRGILWGDKDMAIFTEAFFSDRKVRMNRFNPTTGAVDSLYERSSNDAYSDIGSPVLTKNAFGEDVLLVRKDGSLLLASSGAGPKGDMPLLQTWNLKNGQKKVLWQSADGTFETPVTVIDGEKMVFITRRESPTQTPNYYLHQGKKETALTSFTDPYKALEGVIKQKISYKRADGIDLTGDLYLPKGYDAKKDGPLPVLMWAYPREYKSAADAAQVRGSKYTYTRINYGSPIFWVTQGYAVLDNAEMPIVGEGGKEPNDVFIPQLYLNAHAAIQALAKMGVGDSNRVAVGGHSYGAFMTANLLAHTNLFKAGIARSGAYNRTLTPFGFQSEERTYWQAPEVYNSMSPFTYADKIKTPLLLVHGEMDNNPGTFPIQSERLYNAIKGHGGTVRYLVLPYESHGYSAKENILHLLYEQNAWLEKWVKNAGQNKPGSGNGKVF